LYFRNGQARFLGIQPLLLCFGEYGCRFILPPFESLIDAFLCVVFRVG